MYSDRIENLIYCSLAKINAMRAVMGPSHPQSYFDICALQTSNIKIWSQSAA